MSNTSLRRARTSADAVLQPLQLLQQGDPVRVTEAAAYLDVVRYCSLRNTRNYAVSMGLAERGVNAVAMLIRDPAGDSAGAISLSAPSIRLTRGQIPQVAQIVDQCVHRIQASIAGASGTVRFPTLALIRW